MLKEKKLFKNMDGEKPKEKQKKLKSEETMIEAIKKVLKELRSLRTCREESRMVEMMLKSGSLRKI